MKSNWLKLRIPIALLALTALLFTAHIINVFVFRQIQDDEARTINMLSADTEANKEIINDAAKDIIAYSLDLWHGVDHLRNIHDCKYYQISFERRVKRQKPNSKASYDTVLGVNPEAPDNFKCHLFDSKNGANRKFKNEFGNIKLSSPVIFSAEFQILDKHNPEYKSNETSNTDLAMYMYVSKDLCQEINNQLGMDIDGFTLEKDLPSEEFKGTYNRVKNKTAAPDDGETKEGVSKIFKEKADQMGCWKHSASETYVFYLTLVLRNA